MNETNNTATTTVKSTKEETGSHDRFWLRLTRVVIVMTWLGFFGRVVILMTDIVEFAGPVETSQEFGVVMAQNFLWGAGTLVLALCLQFVHQDLIRKYFSK